MNQIYTERQTSIMLLVIFGVIMLGMTLAWIKQWGTNPMPTVIYIFMMVLFAGVILLFFNMQTVIDNRNITVIYGIGVLKFIIPLDRISSVRCVRNRWYYGAGIRYMPDGIMYSINFTNAVELSDRISPKKIRIGTRNPQKLAEQITLRLINR